MKKEEDLIDFNNEIYRLINDEDLSYMEIFGCLETVKTFYMAKLIKENMKINIIPVVIKK